jgi:hypothetical protein
MPGSEPNPNFADLVLEHRLVVVPRHDQLADAVEERIGRDGERGLDIDGAVDARPAGATARGIAVHAAHEPVVALVLLDRLHPVAALVAVVVVDAQEAGVECSEGDERLERRAEVVATLDRPIDEDRLVGVDRVAVGIDRGEDLVELAAAEVGLEPPVVEGRIAGQRDDLTVLVVLHDDRSRRRLVGHFTGVAGEDQLLEILLGIARVDRDLLPAELQLRLEGLLGELLLIEIDRELHVVAVDRRDTPHLAHDPAGVVDLVGDIAPLAVEFLLHAQFDPELTHALVEVVPLALVEVLGLGGDPPQVTDDVTGDRRIRIDPTRLFEDLDPGEVLDAFLDGDGGAFVDVLGDGHGQEGAVHLALEPSFHLLDRHVHPARQSTEDLGAIGSVADHAPVDGDGEDPIVVRQDATLCVEDATAFGQQRQGAQLGGVDLGLQGLLLDGLQEPDARADEPEHHRADERQDTEASSALVSGHAASARRSTSGSS